MSEFHSQSSITEALWSTWRRSRENDGTGCPDSFCNAMFTWQLAVQGLGDEGLGRRSQKITSRFTRDTHWEADEPDEDSSQWPVQITSVFTSVKWIMFISTSHTVHSQLPHHWPLTVHIRHEWQWQSTGSRHDWRTLMSLLTVPSGKTSIGKLLGSSMCSRSLHTSSVQLYWCYSERQLISRWGIAYFTAKNGLPCNICSVIGYWQL